MHAPFALRKALFPAIAVGLFPLFLAVCLSWTVGPAIFGAIVPLALAAFVLLAWSPLRMRHLRVALHANGLVISTPRAQSIIPFENVDEVWMVLDRRRLSFWIIAQIRAVRVVDRNGRSYRIPLDIQGGLTIVRAILRYCSTPLRAEASRALREGETLTFGKVRISKEGIRGASWAARWSDLRLVRYAPGRVVLFRRQRIIPWRSILLDDVPHPFVFMQLVKECASEYDVDDPLNKYIE